MLILELTAEDRMKYLDPLKNTVAELLECSDYTRIYTYVYLTMIMAFDLRAGETPELVYAIAQVWAKGLADIFGEEPNYE